MTKEEDAWEKNTKDWTIKEYIYFCGMILGLLKSIGEPPLNADEVSRFLLSGYVDSIRQINEIGVDELMKDYKGE